MDKRAFKYLAITLLFSTLFLHSTYADNDTVTDEVNVTIPISCTLSGTGMDSHVTELQNTESDSAIGETIMKAYCNDNNGFSIYAIGFTDDEYGKTVLTDSSIDSTNDIITGTSTSGSTSNWAMKLSTITSPTPTYPITIQNSFDAFHNVPSTYTKVAERNSGTDIGTGAEGSTLKTTYQAYISSTQSAGTYIGQVKYTLVHPYNNTPKDGPIADCPANKICYSPNANDTEGTMGQQSIGNTATTAALLASNFSREGYGFAGWSDKYDYATNSEAKYYGPNETISFTAGQYSTTNGGLRLYAMWIESEGYFQDSNIVSQLCSNGSSSLAITPTDGPAGLDSVSALTDQRDNQTYAIAKLADGKCWMIENLRLEAKYTRSAEDIALAQGYATSATYGNFVGLADAEYNTFSSTTANSLYSVDGSNGTINIGNNDYASHRMPRYNNTNTRYRASNPTNNNSSLYRYGNYYTWHAAIANTSFYGSKNQSIVNSSICPKGWRLPKGGSVTTTVNVTGDPSTFRDYYNLGFSVMGVTADESVHSDSGYSYYNSTTTNDMGYTAMQAVRRYPYNFMLSGRHGSSSPENRNSIGYYFSSTNRDSNNIFVFRLSNSSVEPGTIGDTEGRGFSIRCIISN